MNQPPSQKTPAVLNALELWKSYRAERALSGSADGYCRACERDARSAASVRLQLSFGADPTPHWTGSAADFFAGNAATLDEEDIGAILALDVYESYPVSGGAASIAYVSRIP